MFKEELFDNLGEHLSSGEPAALATVVRREVPSSGKPGDKAIITRSGEVKGWIGGGCTQGIVIKEALEAIEQQSSRLVRIQPNSTETEGNGVKNYRMTCMSGGTVEVYIEPIMQITRITIFGRSPIAQALCQLGAAAGYKMNMVSEHAEKDFFPSASSVNKLSEVKEGTDLSAHYVVVCTQGEDDEVSMRKALEGKPRYVAFVASRKKANSVFLGLKREGVPHKVLASIKTPAGLDINAKTPHEVAISILAQIIQEKHAASVAVENEASMPQSLENDLYINPVCKVPVQKSTAKHVLEYEGEKVYFCCDGCKVSFEKEPAVYMGN